MLEQTLIDALVVLGLFVLRVGLPVAILFGLAAWVERKLRMQENQTAEQRTSGARIIPFDKTRQSTATPRAVASADETTIAKRTNAK